MHTCVRVCGHKHLCMCVHVRVCVCVCACACVCDTVEQMTDGAHVRNKLDRQPLYSLALICC